MFSRLGLVVIAASFGFFSDSYGIRLALMLTGIGLLVVTAITAVASRSKE